VSIFFRFSMDRVAFVCVALAVVHAGQPLAAPESLMPKVATVTSQSSTKQAVLEPTAPLKQSLPEAVVASKLAVPEQSPPLKQSLPEAVAASKLAVPEQSAPLKQSLPEALAASKLAVPEQMAVLKQALPEQSPTSDVSTSNTKFQVQDSQPNMHAERMHPLDHVRRVFGHHPLPRHPFEADYYRHYDYYYHHYDSHDGHPYGWH